MFNGRRSKKSEINITPLVDVMLVLLVVFMVVSPSMHSDIDIKVPVIKHVAHIPKSDKNDLIKLAIASDKLFLNEKLINSQNLAKELQHYKKDLVVFIKADENLSYKRVFEILDLVKSAGFYNIALVGLIK